MWKKSIPAPFPSKRHQTQKRKTIHPQLIRRNPKRRQQPKGNHRHQNVVFLLGISPGSFLVSAPCGTSAPGDSGSACQNSKGSDLLLSPTPVCLRFICPSEKKERASGEFSGVDPWPSGSSELRPGGRLHGTLSGAVVPSLYPLRSRADRRN